MQVKAMLFDLGDTLIQTVDIPETYRRIAANYEVRFDTDKIREAHESVEASCTVESMISLGREFWVKWNTEVLKRAGIQERRDFLAKKIDELWWKYANLEIYPDVMDTLTQLKAKRVKTGIITNGLKRD